MKDINELRGKLSKPLDRSAIKQIPRTDLSSIRQMYVIERLNDVFGLCGWEFEEDTEKQRICTNYDKNGKAVEHVVVRGRIVSPKHNIATPYQYGGSDLVGGYGKNPSDGFKSAVTDCITKCASYLEIGIQVFKGNPESMEYNQSYLPPAKDNKIEIPKDKELELKDSYEEVVKVVKTEATTIHTEESLSASHKSYKTMGPLLEEFGLTLDDIESPTKKKVIDTILMLQENNSEDEKPEISKVEKDEEPEPDPQVEDKVVGDTVEIASKYTSMIPDFTSNGERSMQDARSVWSLMKKCGIGTQTAQNYLEDNLKHYKDVEQFCTKATNPEIVELLEYHVKK